MFVIALEFIYSWSDELSKEQKQKTNKERVQWLIGAVNFLKFVLGHLKNCASLINLDSKYATFLPEFSFFKIMYVFNFLRDKFLYNFWCKSIILPLFQQKYTAEFSGWPNTLDLHLFCLQYIWSERYYAKKQWKLTEIILKSDKNQAGSQPAFANNGCLMGY